MRLKDAINNREILSNIGVFVAFMAFSFLSFTLVSPIVSSNAETKNASVSVGPYTMSISASNNVPINITPTASQTIYTGTSEITYANTCPYGFNVTMSTDTEDTSLSRYGEDNGPKTIPSTTSTSLTDNTWGYSLDNGNTYNPIPAISNPENIIDMYTAVTTAKTLNLTFGVKTDDSLPSGRYSNDVIYTVAPKPQCLTYSITWNMNGGTAKAGATYPNELNFGATTNLTTLTPTRERYIFTGWSNDEQTFDGSESAANINPGNLSSLTMTAQWKLEPTMQTFDAGTMIPNTGDSMNLRDERDDNYYTVKRLADGKVWMTKNLKIINKTITGADSNLPDGEEWAIPSKSVSAFTSTAYNTNNAYARTTDIVFYSFYTATAGWGTTTVTSGYSPKDICPKGWRLPIGGPSGEFVTLTEHYNTFDSLRDETGMNTYGLVNDGTVLNAGYSGLYLSSVVKDANSFYYLAFSNSAIKPYDSSFKRFGMTIRCIAVGPSETMQGFDASSLQTGESRILVDTRDNRRYTVKKLADGNVWMTENLRIANKTITSADSNVSSNFTIPASSISGFSEQDTNYAYVDSTYGGYYSFYAATAGTGGTSLTSGNAPSDICPKGWRLPTGGSSGEFQTLYNNYNSAALMQSVPGFVFSGFVRDGSVRNQDSRGYYWSSTTLSVAGWAWHLQLVKGNSDAYPALDMDERSGLSVRCIAK